MKQEKLERLLEKFKDHIVNVKKEKGETTIAVKLEGQKEVLKFLRHDNDLHYDMLVDLCGVDYFGENLRFEVVYFLRSMRDGDRVRIKVRLGEGEEIESVSDLWLAADWLERETYDMFGIRFKNHPNLKRILLPEDFNGHPLRKDFPPEGYDFEKPYQVKLEEEE
ncbi:MAG: NADH-quinone oxidoreductase subunit C [Desulfobacterota bacterium]|nr:NADH-quinone oxidoreductase subunit C [Thermodesulfobacteriota bacterium]MDW8001849.1 NADH-quinone oxidoreductase subunit C [Deltaproteobacteria bacterium]